MRTVARRGFHRGAAELWWPTTLGAAIIGAGYANHSRPVFLLLLAILIVLAAWRPAAVVALVPAAAALTYHPLQAGSLLFSPTETLVVALTVGAGGRAALMALRSPRALIACARSESPLTSSFLLPAAALLLAGLVSLFTLARPEFRHESVRAFRWNVAEPVLYYLIARLVLRRQPESRLPTAVIFVGAGTLAAIVALLDLARGGGVLTEGVRRISGLSPHPNALALYLDRPLAFAAVAALAFRRRASRLFLILALPPAVATLLTFSRGAALAVGITVVASLAWAGKRRLAGGVALVGLALAGFLVIVARGRLLNLFSGGSGSLRLDLWQSSAAMIRDHPLTGIGLDQFLYSYAPRYIHPEAWSERFTSHPHDIAFDLWLSLGILGLVAAGLYLAIFVSRARAVVRRRRSLGLAGAAVVIAGSLHGLVDNGYFLPDLALLFWFATALLEAEALTEEAEPATAPGVTTTASRPQGGA